MDKILIPVLIVADIGLLAGIILAVAPHHGRAEGRESGSDFRGASGRELRRVRFFRLLRLCGGAL